MGMVDRRSEQLTSLSAAVAVAERELEIDALVI